MMTLLTFGARLREFLKEVLQVERALLWGRGLDCREWAGFQPRAPVTRYSHVGHHLSTLLGGAEWELWVLSRSVLRAISFHIFLSVYRKD